MGLENIDLKHEAKVLRHKASKSLMGTNMFDVVMNSGQLALIIILIGGGVVSNELSTDENEHTQEVHESYESSFGKLSIDYNKAKSNTEKDMALQNILEKIDSMYMEEDLSEQNVRDLMISIKGEIGNIDDLNVSKIGNSSDLDECKALFGEEVSSSKLRGCMVDEVEDDLFMFDICYTIMLGALALSGLGAVAKRVGGNKLEEWATKKPKIIKW